MERSQGLNSQSKLSLLCGIIGIFGSIAVVVTDFIGIIVVEKHNPISETISALAIEKSAWIQDLGLDLFAVGIIACAVGLYFLHLDKIKWKIGNILLLLLGIDIILIAEHNQYAGRPGVGVALHIYFVYALFGLFTLSTFLLASGLRKVHRNWYRFSLGISIFWTVLAPIFFFVPTNIDGAYERFVALIMVTWVIGISWLLVKHGQGKLSKLNQTRNRQHEFRQHTSKK